MAKKKSGWSKFTRSELQQRADKNARARADNSPVAQHPQRMLAFVIKQSSTPKSKQVRDPFQGLYAEGVALAPPLPPERMLALAEENAIHGSCLEATASDAAGHGWSWQVKGNPDQQPDKKAVEALDDLLESITPEYSFSELLFQAAWETRAVGWAAWEIQRDAGGAINAIFPMPSQTLRATPKDDIFVQIRGGITRYFIRFGTELRISRIDGKESSTLRDEDVAVEVLLFKFYTPRSIYYGVPQWVSGIPTIAELTAIREFNVSWFSSSGQQDRSVHITAKDAKVAEALAEEIQRQFEEHSGIGHTTLVTSGSEDTKVQVQQLALPSREGHFRLRRGDLVKEVLMAHQVPPFRIGWIDLGALGGGSTAAKDMMDTYRHSVVKPIQKFLVDRLKHSLFDPKKGIDTGGLLFTLHDMDIEEMMAAVKEVVQTIGSAVQSPNEGRMKLGLPKSTDPNMDKHYIAVNLMPLDLANDPPEPAAPAAPSLNGNGSQPKAGAKPKVVSRRYARQAEGALEVIEQFEATLRGFLEKDAAEKAVGSTTP